MVGKPLQQSGEAWQEGQEAGWAHAHPHTGRRKKERTGSGVRL